MKALTTEEVDFLASSNYGTPPPSTQISHAFPRSRALKYRGNEKGGAAVQRSGELCIHVLLHRGPLLGKEQVEETSAIPRVVAKS